MHCYVYRLDSGYNSGISSSECRKTGNFDLPLKRDRGGNYKAVSGTVFFTCFTSDFFISDADEWRNEAWNIIKTRSDCTFFFFTKRIDRFYECIPDDWGSGYDNVIIGCTVENQKMADFRLPIFLQCPIKHRRIGVEPMLERIDISQYLCGDIEEVSAGGESGPEARVCDYNWILDLRRQCLESHTRFTYHQTGSRLLKDGRLYSVPRRLQSEQAMKANINI